MIALLIEILPPIAVIFSLISFLVADTENKRSLSMLLIIISLVLMTLSPWLLEVLS